MGHRAEILAHFVKVVDEGSLQVVRASWGDTVDSVAPDKGEESHHCPLTVFTISLRFIVISASENPASESGVTSMRQGSSRCSAADGPMGA